MNKKILYVISGLVVLAFVALAIITFKPEESANKQPLRDQVEVTLTDEQKQNLEKFIADTQGKLEAAKTQDVREEEVFKLYLDLGLGYYGLGNLKAAKEAYLQALDMDPRNPGVWVALLPVYRDMYDYDMAREAARKVLSVNGKDWNVWRSYIELEQYHFNADREKLNELYLDALEATQHDINIVTVYAKFLEEGGDLQSALNYWKTAVQQHPDNVLYKEEVKRLETALNK